MNVKTKKRLVLMGFVTTIVLTTTIVTTNSFVSASVTSKTSPVVIAQKQRNVATDEQQIVKAVLLDNQPISPQAPVRVDKIAIAGSFALASVLIGEHGGGMTALAKKQDGWQVIGGAGGWMVLNDLVKLGIPRRSAQILMEQIDPNWRNYEPQ